MPRKGYGLAKEGGPGRNGVENVGFHFLTKVQDWVSVLGRIVENHKPLFTRNSGSIGG